ncbi:hypothetical protein [Maricaulis sp. CAU 1757]
MIAPRPRPDRSSSTSKQSSAREVSLAQLLDTDIISFCAGHYRLTELAFTLADHGHVHVGQVAQLTPATVRDLADGDQAQVLRLRRLLIQSDLDFGLVFETWQAPDVNALDTAFE